MDKFIFTHLYEVRRLAKHWLSHKYLEEKAKERWQNKGRFYDTAMNNFKEQIKKINQMIRRDTSEDVEDDSIVMNEEELSFLHEVLYLLKKFKIIAYCRYNTRRDIYYFTAMSFSDMTAGRVYFNTGLKSPNEVRLPGYEVGSYA